MENILAYTSEGIGKPLVFLHGFCESKEIWTRFKEYFTRGYHVVCIDLPGFGQSNSPENSIEAMAERLHHTLLYLQIEKPVLVGHSLGGYVALAYAQTYEYNISGVCLFHSTAFADTEEKKENRNKTIEYVLKHGVDAFRNPFVPGLFFPRLRKEIQSSIDYVLSIATQTKLETIVETTKAMRDRVDRTSVLESINVPVSFIIGKNDNAVPLDRSVAQCSMPKKSYVLFLDETAHMGMFERENDCASFLLAFLACLP